MNVGTLPGCLEERILIPILVIENCKTNILRILEEDFYGISILVNEKTINNVILIHEHDAYVEAFAYAMGYIDGSQMQGE